MAHAWHLLAAIGLAASAAICAVCWWAKLKPIVLEPDTASWRVAALEGRPLRADEVESYNKYGIVVVRGAIADRGLLKDLLPAIRRHANTDSAKYIVPHYYNGAVRALLRSRHLTELGVNLSGYGQGWLEEAPVWGFDRAHAPDNGKFLLGNWHIDSTEQSISKSVNMVTGWLAITDAPHAVEYLRGSWHDDVRAQLFRSCNMSYRMGSKGERMLDRNCVRKLSESTIDKQLGYKTHAYYDLKAGDVVFFDGRILHRSTFWPRGRVAIAFRLQFNKNYKRNTCRCERDCVAVPVATSSDPFGCLREVAFALPLPPKKWPKWVAGIRLPAKDDLAAGTDILRQACAGLGGALLSWM